MNDLHGWHIEAALQHAQSVGIQEEDGLIKVDSTWDILLAHEDGTRELFQQCYFGDNLPNMLVWCAEQAQIRALKRAEGAAAETFWLAVKGAGINTEPPALTAAQPEVVEGI